MAETITIIIEALDQTKDALGGVQNSFSNVGGELMKIGGGLTAGVTVPLVGIGTAAAKMAGDFEQQMNILTIAARSSGTSLGDLSDAALRVGSDTELVGITAAQSADAMTSLYKAGFDTAEIFGGEGGLNSYLNENASLTGSLRSAIDLAAASELDLAGATDVTIIAMKTFGLDADEASRVANSFVRTADASVASVSDLSEAMKNIGPTAATFGMSLETTNTALGILSSRGIAGAEAGTALKSMLTNMMRQTPAVSDAWQTLGIKLYDATGKMRPMPDVIADLSNALRVGNVITAERSVLTEKEIEQIAKLEKKREDLAKKDLAIRDGTLMVNATQKERVAELKKVDKALEETVWQMEQLKQKEGQTVTVTTQVTEEFRNQTVQTLAGTYGMKAMNTLLTEGAAGWKGMETSIASAASVEESAGARTKGFNAAMEQLGGALETIAIKAGGPIINALTNLLQGPVSGLLDKISNLNPVVWDWALKIGLVIAAVGPLLLGLGMLLSTIGSVVSIVTVLGPLLGITGATIGALALPVLAIIGVIALLAVAWAKDWGGIREITASVLAFIQGLIQGALAAISGWWSSHSAQIMPIVTGLWSTLQSIFTVATDTIKMVISDTLGIIMDWWDEHGASVMVIVDVLMGFLGTIFETTFNVISTIVSTVLGVIGVVWQNHGQMVMGVVTALWSIISGIFRVGADIVGGIIDVLALALTGQWDRMLGSLKETANRIWEDIKGIFRSAKEAMAHMFDGVHIPLPHFTVKWQTVLGVRLPSGVDVKWYGTGLDALFTRPTLIGVGEAGPERVVVQPVGRAGSSSGGARYQINVTYKNAESEGSLRDLIRMLEMATP